MDSLRGEDKGEGEITTLPIADCRMLIDNCIAGWWLLIADWKKNKQQPATSKQQMKRAWERELSKRARNEIIGRGDPV